MRNIYLVLGAVGAALLSANCGRTDSAVEQMEQTGANTQRLVIPTSNEGVVFNNVHRTLVAAFAERGAPLANVSLPLESRDRFTVRNINSERLGLAVETVGIRNVTAQIENGLVHYRDAFGEGTDVMHRVTPEGTEDYVSFASAPAEAKLSYKVSLGKEIAGLRLLSDTLEFLDSAGTPRLRINPPAGVDARGNTFAAHLAVNDCAVDSDPRAPWGREVTRPGGSICTVHVTWDSNIAYPATIDPAWVTGAAMAQNNVSYEMLMAKLTGGKVLVANAGPSTQIFDPSTDTWAVTGNPVTAVAHRSRLIATDGNTALEANGSNNAIQTYDLGTGVWTAGTVVAGGFDGNGVTVSNLGGNNVLVVQANGQAYIYDRVAKTYTTKAATGSSFGCNPGAFKISASSYAFTGCSVSQPWVYNVDTNVWTHPAANVAGDANCNNLELLSDGRVLSYSQDGAASVLNLTTPSSTAVTGIPAGFNVQYLCARTGQIPFGTTKKHFLVGGRFTYDEVTNKITDNGAFPSTATLHGAIVQLDDGRYLAAGGNQASPNKLVDIYTANSSAECSGNPFGTAGTPIYNAASKKCVACDGDNSGATTNKCPSAGSPACQTGGALSGQCTQCSATNKTLCTGATPNCNTTAGTCTACDGDNGGATTYACATAGSPACHIGDGLAGQCTQCSATNAALCTGTTPACESTTGMCAMCNGGFGSTATAACRVGTAPACKADGSCVAANGDNGTGATAPCPTLDNPFSKGDGTCGKCTSNTDCTTGANHGGTICNLGTGACGNVCVTDADCTASSYCDLTAMPKVCAAKKAGGSTCATAVECSSGSCTATKCDTGCTTGADCTAGNYCDTGASPKICKAQKANGAACTAAAECSGGACTANVCATALTDAGVTTDASTSADSGTSTGTDSGSTEEPTTRTDSGTGTKDSGASTLPSDSSTGDDGGCSCTTVPQRNQNGLLALGFAGVLGLVIRRKRARA